MFIKLLKLYIHITNFKKLQTFLLQFFGKKLLLSHKLNEVCHFFTIINY